MKGLGKLKPIPWDGPRLHSCCAGYSLRAASSGWGWKKAVIAPLHQLGPLCSPKNRLRVSGWGNQLHSCAEDSIPAKGWEANPGPGTTEERGRGGWCNFAASNGCYRHGRNGWRTGTCPVFGSAAGLLLLLVGRGAASGWVECTPHAVGLLAYHHGKALCQLLSGNTVIWSSLILLVPCEWGLANRSFPRSASLRETSCLPRAWVCSLFSAVPMPKCLVVSRRLEMFVLFLEVSLHWNIAVSSTAVNCTLWQK